MLLVRLGPLNVFDLPVLMFLGPPFPKVPDFLVIFPARRRIAGGPPCVFFFETILATCAYVVPSGPTNLAWPRAVIVHAIPGRPVSPFVRWLGFYFPDFLVPPGI